MVTYSDVRARAGPRVAQQSVCTELSHVLTETTGKQKAMRADSVQCETGVTTHDSC